MDPDPAAGPSAGAGVGATSNWSLVNQTLLMVVGLLLGLGLAYMVIVLARSSGESRLYGLLAGLSVIAVAAGALAGYQASYGLVTNLVQSVGGGGSGIVFFFGVFLFQSITPAISIAISLAVGVISMVTRVAEIGTAAVMLAGSVVVFELTRRGFLFSWSILAAPLWMTGAALLLGNGLAGLRARPAP